MTVFLVSDTHFRHKNIITAGLGRPFDSIEEHDEALIANWNSVVGKDDTVVHFGDVVMGPRIENLPILDRLNGYKILIPGNHDYPSATEDEKRRQKYLTIYGMHFNEIWPDKITVENVVMSHYPPIEIPDHGEERFAYMRPASDEADVFLHGHSHQQHVRTELPGGRVAISVGVDANNYTPVAAADIPELAGIPFFERGVSLV